MNLIETIKHDFRFPGHILPGTAFIILGFWWMANTIRIYINSKDATEESSLYEDTEPMLDPHPHCTSNNCKMNKTDDAIQSDEFYPCTFNGNSSSLFHCEGIIKLCYASFDLFCHILVVITGGSLVDEAQHMTVYVFFIFNALIDITVFRSRNNRNPRRLLPVGSDSVFGCLAWTGFGFLFLSHKHHKSEIQIYYHVLLAWIAIGVGLAHLIQWKYNGSAIGSFLRSWCCVLAGTWLYQIAFTFHNPFVIQNGVVPLSGIPLQNQTHTNTHNHANHVHNVGITSTEHDNIMMIMFGATAFTWHVILVLICTLIFGLLISVTKSRSDSRTKWGYRSLPTLA